MSTKPGTLWVVATPIGNLDDLAPRAREVLGRADLVAAEDTRHTGQLLAHFGIDAKQLSLHEHNEERRVPQLIRRLQGGSTVALVSDAGTPLISDPGYRLVRAAREAGIPVSTVPGPCAPVAALSIAGLSTDRFHFEGFLPARAGARRKRLQVLSEITATLLFFETPRRVRATLADMNEVLGPDREAALSREITKLHETTLNGNLAELARRLDAYDEQLRGEMVLVVAGASNDADEEQKLKQGKRLFELLREELPAGKAARLAAKWTGCRRRDLYE